MKIKSLKLPAVIIAIGLIASVVAWMLTGMVKEPTITEHEFPYSVTYKLDGETQTLEGIYRCRFNYTGAGMDPLERHYEGSYPLNPSEYYPAAYTIAQKDGLELCVVTIFSDKYLMGDAKGEPESTFFYEPYLAVIDEEGAEYDDPEMLGKFNAELVSWELPVPVNNSFVFVGFSKLHDESMMAMLVVAALVIVACMIFVKRDKSVPYKVLDKVSLVLNVLITVAVIPFFAVIACAVQIFAVGPDWIYQVEFLVPVITAFSVAASLSLRREGFTKSGFLVQFAGPLLFVLLGILE